MKQFEVGEQLVKQFLETNSIKVTDVTLNPTYWSKDIDFIAEPLTSAPYTLEVKWDNVMARTGNLYLELTANCATQEHGWFTYTEADFLFYGDAQNHIVYIFSMDELRKWIKDNNGYLNLRRATDYDSCGNYIKESLGYLLPLDKVKGYYRTISV